jgi:hypothetical protein
VLRPVEEGDAVGVFVGGAHHLAAEATSLERDVRAAGFAGVDEDVHLLDRVARRLQVVAKLLVGIRHLIPCTQLGQADAQLSAVPRHEQEQPGAAARLGGVDHLAHRLG